jgi:hypothetical protein
MTQRATIIIPVLGAAIVILAVALILVWQDRIGPDRMPDRMGAANGYQGMMQAMGSRDSETMLEHMQQILSPEDYQRMVQHMAAHRAGGTMPMDPQIDGVMHHMMDGMFQQMPEGRGRMMPLRPSVTPSATPAR